MLAPALREQKKYVAPALRQGYIPIADEIRDGRLLISTTTSATTLKYGFTGPVDGA